MNVAPIRAVLVISDMEFGGAQRQVVELVNHMDPGLCGLHICSLSQFVPLADSLRERERRLSVIERRFRLDFTVVLRLAAFLRKLRADVVHTFLFDATIAGRLAGLLAGRPAIVGSERNADYKLKAKELVALKATRRLNDLTIANSRAGAAFNCRLFGQTMERCRVVHNGVDVERFRPRSSETIRRELGVSAGEPIVGMFASFKPQKNHLCWLRAARRVVKEIPKVKLLFVGDELFRGGSGSAENKMLINRAVDELGLRDRCIFAANRADVEQCYNACQLTVLPSFYEGTPNVLLESMACGTPVVASNVSDNGYIVEDGASGFIVPVDDEEALAERALRLLRDESLRHRLAEAARERAVREFSCSRLAEKTLVAYQDALELRKGTSRAPGCAAAEQRRGIEF